MLNARLPRKKDLQLICLIYVIFATVSVAGYREMEGDCTGNNMSLNHDTREQCAAHCTATSTCAGWVYAAAGTRQWPHTTCHLKNKMCVEPSQVPGLVITSYYKKSRSLLLLSQQR